MRRGGRAAAAGSVVAAAAVAVVPVAVVDARAAVAFGVDVDALTLVVVAVVVVLPAISLEPSRYGAGLVALPFSRTSKWRCGPVQEPVQPTLPITSPTWT